MSTELTDQRLDEIEAIANAATPGPWNWRVNQKARRVVLESHGRGSMLEIVLDFVRWGMSGAKPRFLDQVKCRMVDADKLSVVIPGREHHEEWARDISHPDANFIASSRAAVAELIAEVRRLRLAVQQYQQGDGT